MARPAQHDVETFMSITGASAAVALQKLEEHNGDLNEAVNAHFNEGDRGSLAASAPLIHNDFMNIDEPIDVDSSEPVLPLLSAARDLNPFSLLEPTFRRNFIGGGGGSYGVSSSIPRVSHPKDVREIPIEVKDGSSQPGSSVPRPIIEDVTDIASIHGPEIHGTVFIDDDDDEVLPSSPPKGGANGFISSPGPSVMEYNNEIEEEMIRAAIEASKRDAENPDLDTKSPGTEDVEFVRAVSMSLRDAPQAAAQERTSPEQGMDTGENERHGYVSSKTGTSSRLQLEQEETEDVEEQPLERRRRSMRIASRNRQSTESEHVVDGPQSSRQRHESSSRPQYNGDAFQGDEWGGISSDEHVEAVMLEAALFGGIPEGSGYPFAYPSHHVLPPDSETNSSLYPRVPRPPSPTLTAQRLLREEQDDAYLASLQADREKELKAKQEAEDAMEKERHQEEETRRKLLEEEEFERTLAAKEASLPQEPSADDEGAVTLLVRMPDGSRRERRFLKSDMLKALFDYIDVGRVVKPSTYRLIRPFPRRAFTEEEQESSLSELGLTSKQEALYLELIQKV